MTQYDLCRGKQPALLRKPQLITDNQAYSGPASRVERGEDRLEELRAVLPPSQLEVESDAVQKYHKANVVIVLTNAFSGQAATSAVMLQIANE